MRETLGQRRHVAALAVGLALLALVPGAVAADGDPYLKSCYSVAAPPCTALAPPFRASDAEVSADGRHLYVIVWDNGGGYNGVRLFDAGAGGTITPRPGGEGVTGLPGQAYDLDLSTDGRNAYVAAGNQFVVFNRNTATGALAQVQCLGTGAGCMPVRASNSFTSSAVSPDGLSVYARGTNQLAVFNRDAGSGLLTQKTGPSGCLTQDPVVGCTDVAGVGGDSFESVVSSDGRHLYVTSSNPGGVAIFNRAADGTVSQLAGTVGGCIAGSGTECASGPATLNHALAANVDPQGAFVFVSGESGNTVFRRDTGSGTLAQTDCLDEVGPPEPPRGCHEVKGAAGGDAAATADGRNVVLNASGFGLSFFALDRRTGKLASRPSRTCVSSMPSPPCDHIAGLMGGLGSVAISSNGLYLFSAFRGGAGGAIASFERDVAPICQGTRLRVTRSKPVFVKLTCTDANGDPIALEITNPPLEGTLGTLDQTNDRVRYTPSPDAGRRDKFQFRGTARGAGGPSATVTLTILGRRPSADRKAPDTRITAGPKKTTVLRTARFRFRSTERGSSFQCKIDRKRWATCHSPKHYGALKRGLHTFRVRAIDRAGNVDRKPAQTTWIVR